MLKRINSIFILTVICLGVLLFLFNVDVNTKKHSMPFIAKESGNIGKNNSNIKKITFLAAGDIMFHIPQIESAYNGKTYDFKSAFEEIRPIVQNADISLANFEAVILPEKGYTGFPKFNVPVQTLEAIKYSGFDLLSLANNHIMDYGQEGLYSTRALIEKAGMAVIGAGKRNDKKYYIINKNGIKLGILSYTFGTNLVRAQKNTVNYIDLTKIKEDIKEIKRESDFVIVYLHSGTEYVREIEEKQRILFREIADLGADCILNSHPHVARGSELYRTNGREVFINYSLGNLLSNQNDKFTDIGLMIKLEIIKVGKLTKLENSEILPTYRLRYKTGNKVNYKIVLCDNIDKYRNLMDIKDIEYVKVNNNQFAPEAIAVFKNK